MIILKKLTWDNCFSYGPGNVLDLNSSVVTQLVGTNGMGKSSIPLIIEEVLYNKNSKNIKKADIENRNLKNGYNIQLEFSIGNDEFVISVKRKSSGVVKLIKNGEDISSHTATNTFKTIESLIGLDFKTFSQLVYQNTNTSLQFLTATDTVRKKFLIDLFSLDDYVAFFDVFKDASKELSSEHDKHLGKISTIESWLKRNEMSDATLLEHKILPNRPEEEEKALRSLLADFKNFESQNKKILQNNKFKELLKALNIRELQSKNSELEDLSKLESGISGHKTMLAIVNRQIEENKDAPDKCRTCGQSIDNSISLSILKEALASKEQLQEELKVLTKVLSDKLAANKELRLIKDKIKQWEDLYTKVDNDIPTELFNEKELETQIHELETHINSVNKEIINIIDFNSKVDVHNNKVKAIEEQTEEYREELEQAVSEKEELAEKLGRVDVLKKAFSTNGLIAYKIENLVKELEDFTNTYLAELSDGRFTIEFVIIKDKLNVEITDNGKPVDILALSSGELARVNTATLIAIRKLMSSISKTKINILFLDEVISVLDEQGKEKLIEVLLKEEDLNSYVVSHGWTHPLLDKIEVIKENNISRLE